MDVGLLSLLPIVLFVTQYTDPEGLFVTFCGLGMEELSFTNCTNSSSLSVKETSVVRGSTRTLRESHEDEGRGHSRLSEERHTRDVSGPFTP